VDDGGKREGLGEVYVGEWCGDWRVESVECGVWRSETEGRRRRVERETDEEKNWRRERKRERERQTDRQKNRKKGGKTRRGNCTSLRDIAGYYYYHYH